MMNIAKNMEAFFVAAAVVAGFATYATADVAPAPAKPLEAMITTDNQVATVVVSAKRLTPAQKANLDS